MPVIVFEGPKMDNDIKARLIRELTQKASEILDMPKQSIVVLLKESSPDNVGVGGEPLSMKNK